MSRKLPILLIMLLVLAGSVLVALRQRNLPDEIALDNDVPYIYYYSYFLDGFVIERADGTDSRVVPVDIPGNIIESLVWSPSGRYLAADVTSLSVSPIPNSVIVASVDGSSSHLVLDEVYGVYGISWSPNDDLLLVSYYNYDRRNGGHLVFDPETGEQVITWETNQSGGSEIAMTWWASDGQSIFWAGYFIGQDLFMQQSLDGMVTQRIFYNDNFLLATENRLAYVYTDNRNRLYELIVEDLNTGEQWVVDSFTREHNDDPFPDYTYDISWSPDESRALLRTEENSQQVEQRLLEWETRTITSLPANMPLGRTFNRYTSYVLWLDNDNLLTQDEGVLSHVNLATLQTQTLADGFEYNYRHDRWSEIWIQTDQTILFRDDEKIMQYDLATQTLREYAQIAPDPGSYLIGDHDIVSLSPDARFITQERTAYPSLQAVSGDDVALMPHSIARGALMTTLWDANAQWLIATYNLDRDPYCCTSLAQVIQNIDGSVRREFNACGGECYGFVPDHVVENLNAGQETSLIPAPTVELRHDESVISVVWSPDGTQLATLSSPNFNGGGDMSTFVHIWSLTTSPPEIVEEYQHPTCEEICYLSWTEATGLEADTRRRDFRAAAYEPMSLRDEDGSIALPDTWTYTLEEHNDFSYTFRDRASGEILATIPARDDALSLNVLNVEEGVLTLGRYLWDANALYALPVSSVTDYNRAEGLVSLAGGYRFEETDEYAVWFPNFVWDLETEQRIEFTNVDSFIARLNPQGTQVAIVNQNDRSWYHSPVVTIWNLPE